MALSVPYPSVNHLIAKVPRQMFWHFHKSSVLANQSRPIFLPQGSDNSIKRL